MKRIKKHSFALLLPLVIGAMTGAACSNPQAEIKMVEAQTFEQSYQTVDMPGSMHFTKFQGVKDGVALLEIHKMSPLTKKWNRQQIGVKLEDLNPDFRAQMQQADKELKEFEALGPEEKAERLEVEKEEREAQMHIDLQKLLQEQAQQKP